MLYFEGTACGTNGSSWYSRESGYPNAYSKLPPQYSEDERREAIYEENKETHRRFISGKAGLPRMFQRWYR